MLAEARTLAFAGAGGHGGESREHGAISEVKLEEVPAPRGLQIQDRLPCLPLPALGAGRDAANCPLELLGQVHELGDAEPW